MFNLQSAIQNLASELKKFVVNHPHSSFLLAAQEQRLYCHGLTTIRHPRSAIS
jgi:hypothetical protein